MKALHIVSGNPSYLEVADVAKPTPGEGQALVRIHAAGLNRADLHQLRGNYPAPPGSPPDIPGLEFAGVVESLGPQCSRVAPRERVFGLCGGGAQAQYLAIPEGLLMPVPSNLTDEEAAAVPEAFVTAHDALVTQARMESGERVLVHAAGSGVGLAALQIAAAWNCETFGTSRNQQKLEAVERLGVDSRSRIGHVFGLTPDSFDEEILRLTQGEGVDIILDPVGAAYFERNLRALASRGCLVILSTLGGSTASLPIPVLMAKRLEIIGTMLRNRSVLEKAAATKAFQDEVLPKFIAGELRPIIDKTFPLEKAAEAYDYMAADKNFGKIVLSIG